MAAGTGPEGEAEITTASPAAPTVQSTARRCGHRPVEAQLARYADGRVVALSLTEPGVTYELTRTPSGWRCACKGYQYRGSCYHAAALERFGVPCWFCAAVEGVELYQNPYEPETPLMLCAPCARRG